MKIKSKSVKINNLVVQLYSKLDRIENVCKLVNGNNYEMVITSGNDGVHMKNSKHYSDCAVDIRSNDMTYPKQTTSLLKSSLGRDYDVLFEIDHIHIEFDPK